MLTTYVQGASLYTIIATILVALLSYIITKRKKKAIKPSLNIHLLNKRILEYNPEPLFDTNAVPKLRKKNLELPVPDESNPRTLNLAKANYLDFLNNEGLKRKAEECIRKYGVGSCGPRGFYGTIDVHLDLESSIAEFMGMEETVLYSYAFSTISSAVGAYCKKSDIVFCDEHISFPAQQGLLASKCTIVYFKHNDTEDLEEKLKVYKEKEEKRKKLYRKFLLTEGINGKTGKICPLPELIALRRKYMLRFFLDESLSFGVLGKTGRGITEYFDVDKSDIDMIMGSLEGSLGSIGGFCVGSSFIIEHQRLSGLGYCFSASLPPFLSYVAICAINLMKNDTTLFERLQNMSTKVHEMLLEIPEIRVSSHPLCPKKVIELKDESLSIQSVHKHCSNEDVYMLISDDKLFMNLNINFSDENLERIIEVLSEACKKHE